MGKIKEGYKKTEIGVIPEDWEVKRIGDIALILMGQSPTGDSYNNERIGTPLLNGPTAFGLTNPTPIQWTTKPTKICEIDDILFCVRGSSTGRMNIANDKYCIGRGLASISRRQSVSDTKFIYYLLQKNIDILLKACVGSTFPNISKDGIGQLNVGLPKLDEQQNIVEILSIIDEYIYKLDKTIEDYQFFKKSMMKKLLTEGIGHTEFKDTEIGRIPREWEVNSIEKFCTTSSGGTPTRSNRKFYDNGVIPWIKTGELNKKYIYASDEKITELAVQKSSAKLADINSVLIAMYGATIGKCSILKVKATTNQACCIINPSKDIGYYEYVYYYLDFDKDNIVAKGAGGAQPNISQKIIRQHKIPLPPLQEQHQIAEILSQLDTRIEQYQNQKQDFLQLKKGLMEKLLTGKIRVKC